MYLADREILAAIKARKLIVKPNKHIQIGPTSVDLHLDKASKAKIWDMKALVKHNEKAGNSPKEVHVAKANYWELSAQFLIPPPRRSAKTINDLVVRYHDMIVIRPHGFVLWQTKEIVGTPEDNPEFICFVDGKSTRARAGLLVHLTAPTIHAGWKGPITLEMSNLGPFDIVLQENDVVAQIIVAQITGPPTATMADIKSKTHEQKSVGGRSSKQKYIPKKPKK